MINKFDLISYDNLQTGKKILDMLYLEYYESNKRNLIVLESDEYDMLMNLVKEYETAELENMVPNLDNLNDNELAAVFCFISAETY